jgi:hypothetical protein
MKLTRCTVSGLLQAAGPARESLATFQVSASAMRMRFPIHVLFALLTCSSPRAEAPIDLSPKVEAPIDYTGIWKRECSQRFGIQIKGPRGGPYSVTFCGPQGCFPFNTWMPITSIDGDPDYKIISHTEIGVRRRDDSGGFFMFHRCTDDPTWKRGDSLPDFLKREVISISG